MKQKYAKEGERTEQKKCGRGRPRIDTHITEYGAPSRRQAINAMYMFEGVHLISAAAAEITARALLWHPGDAARTEKRKNGILEQLGRMSVQDLKRDRKGRSQCANGK